MSSVLQLNMELILTRAKHYDSNSSVIITHLPHTMAHGNLCLYSYTCN